MWNNRVCRIIECIYDDNVKNYNTNNTVGGISYIILAYKI